MFIFEKEEDMFGKPQVHYWLTQGDSCSIQSTPYDDKGEIVDPTLIAAVKFKIYNTKTRIIVFEKQMTVFDSNSYLLEMTAEESAAIPLGDYRYEIEYTFTGGAVQTPNQYDFTITEQGIEQGQ